MSRFESVPNFSEGRDAAKVDAIASAGRAVPGVTVLDVEKNADHNRSVLTLVGEGEPLSEALFRMMQVAVATIDLRQHVGEHPRMGAVDVVPFVPLGDATMEEAVRLSEKLGERVARELGVPVYLYAASARVPERADLAYVRRGQFEAIRDTIASDPTRRPDFGEPRIHPSAGAVAIGARPVLIAYNVYLATNDVAIAKKVAKAVRARDGGLAEVKALGFEIKERDRAQVSMNLTDYRRTAIPRVVEAVRAEAGRYGVGTEESEIVGLVPEDALLDAAEHFLQLNTFDRQQILERRLNPATSPAGPVAPARLADSSIREFSRRLADRTPTPGGGSASAAAGAFGAALGEMVLRYTDRPETPDPALTEAIRWLAAARATLLDGVDADTDAYEALRAARKARKAAPDDPAGRTALVAALRHATEVPLATARTSREAWRRLEALRPRVRPSIASDLDTALALLYAATRGALANVLINLPDLEAVGGDAASLRAEAEALSVA